MGAKVKDQCTLVRRRASERGYVSPQDSIFITGCIFLYNHKNQYCVLYAAYMCENITCTTSVHVYPHESYMYMLHMCI